MDRKEKERLYIKKMSELQRRWQNPLPTNDEEWELDQWTDEQLDKGLEDTIGQLRFEKSIAAIKYFFLSLISGFILLGLIGLLVFGIKQLF